MASVGDGWLWPQITISSDGVWVELELEPSPRPDVPVFYYPGRGSVRVPRTQFESAVDEFVGQNLTLLEHAGFRETNLHLLWEDLRLDREDPDISAFRQFEALLGGHPQELDSSRLLDLLEEIGTLGEKAAEELVSGAGGLEGVPSVGQLKEVTRTQGLALDSQDAFRSEKASVEPGDSLRWGEAPAGTVGREVAERVRGQIGLDGKPMSDRSLTSLAGTSAGILSPGQESGTFSWILREEDGSEKVVLRSKWQTGRRFELARLLGDTLLFDSAEGDELLLPATRSYSYRQKAQRAFAAELLSPWHEVKELLRGDYSPESRKRVADHFMASPMIVSTMLKNNEGVDFEDEA